MPQAKRRIWVFSEVYYPEATGTGYYLTRIAEHLASSRPVSTLCVQPSYSRAGDRAAVRETHHGVEIFRCPAIIPGRKTMSARLLKMASISLSLLFFGLWRVRRGEVILAVTNPPTMPVVAAIVSFAKRASYILVVHDLYPDIMAACGIASPRSLGYRLMHRVNRLVLRRAASITTIGYCMRQRLASACGTACAPIEVIPLWSDCADVRPMPKGTNPLLQSLGLLDKMVVLYAGNMGHPHGIDTLAEVTRLLRPYDDIHFIFIGSGSKRRILEELVEEGAPNVTVLPPRPRAEQSLFLNACDVSILSLVSGMLGIAVPSRTYNIMAAGKPVIALVPEGSETARVVRDEGIGWVVQPGNPHLTAAVILTARKDRALLRQMGARARVAAETKYPPEKILHRFDTLAAGVG